MDHTCQNNLYDGHDSEVIFNRSASRWRTILSQAKNMTEIPNWSLDLTRCLDRIPRLPDKIPSSSRWLEGFSTWGDSNCFCSVKTKRERKQRLFLTKLHPTNCSISASPSFRIWKAKANNGIALLTLGWAYILSASLAERQGLSMEYGPLATPPASTQFDLEYASPSELRWWKAIVTPGLGWSVTGSKLTPWAIAVRNLEIRIGGNADSNQRPPTARQAACYLSRLCDAYDLGAQCSAALAAALTIPLHANTTPLKSAAIELPKPSFTIRYKFPESPMSLPTDFHLIDYYMTLSLCPWVLGPSLWSVFWSPHVPCNRVGAWILPIVDILEPVIQKKEMELLAKILSFSPVSPLWLGLTLCGHGTVIRSILPSLTELRDYPFFRPSVDAAAWTGVAQSFMDYGLSDASTDGTVSRADVWRMRHDFSHVYPDETFSYTPPYGWPPFGSMRAEDVELEIRGHLACSHQWRYLHWTWSFSGRTDAGFSSWSMRTQHPDEDSIATGGEGDVQIKDGELVLRISRTATEAVFRWSCDQVEKGFGGTIVPRRFGPDEALKNTETCEPKDMGFIQAWLKAIET
ncbi:hypothetical protein ACJZ2D_016454 [Fusarium nematophilum]